MTGYLMSGQLTELERLRLQSQVWEPGGQRLLARLGDGTGRRVLDIGCGAMGWLRPLSEWAGDGQVTGTDIDPHLLEMARQFTVEAKLANIDLIEDDLFSSRLPPASFDLVHARFQIAPIGRPDEQLASYLRLARPGGHIVLEDPDSVSWRYNPEAPALIELIELIRAAFRAGGGDFDAGRQAPQLLRAHGLDPKMHAEVLALPPGHPYLRLPLQFSASLRPRLLDLTTQEHLDELRARAEDELSEPDRWGTTFTLIQTWAVVRTG